MNRGVVLEFRAGPSDPAEEQMMEAQAVLMDLQEVFARLNYLHLCRGAQALREATRAALSGQPERAA